MSENLEPRDEDLVLAFRKGDDEAFTTLYRRYESRLKRLIYYYMGDAEAAEDVFHEVFIRVFRHMNTFNVSMQFSSWIYRIAVNCSKNHIRQRKKVDVVVEREQYRLRDEGREQVTPEEELLEAADLAAFTDAVSGLKEKFRDVFVLRFDHRMKYGDIASILACSERTAKWRMKRAVEMIARELQAKQVI